MVLSISCIIIIVIIGMFMKSYKNKSYKKPNDMQYAIYDIPRIHTIEDDYIGSSTPHKISDSNDIVMQNKSSPNDRVQHQRPGGALHTDHNIQASRWSGAN